MTQRHRKVKKCVYLAFLAVLLLGGLIYTKSNLNTREARFSAISAGYKATYEMNCILRDRIRKAIVPEVKAEDSLVSETIREVTAYNTGDFEQCSGNPCISANSENICLALESGYKRCAANFVPFGTRLHIEHYGECLVVDRLASKYQNRVDIAMRLDEKERAVRFGLQRLNVKILK